MKLGFSTLGCSDWSLRDTYAAAKDLGFQGIEVRRLENERYAPRIKSFSGEKLAASAALLRDGGIEIPVLATRVTFGGEMPLADAEQEVKDYAALANALGCPYLKLALGSKPTDLSMDADTALANIRALCAAAKEAGVALLITTNGAFCKSETLAAFIEKAGCDNLFALWDLNYTCRVGKETPAQSLKNIGALVRFVHIKDSLDDNGTIAFRPVGNGDVPIRDAVRGLVNMGYDGYLSAEWKKSWGEAFGQPGIVLSRFASYMTRMIDSI